MSRQSRICERLVGIEADCHLLKAHKAEIARLQAKIVELDAEATRLDKALNAALDAENEAQVHSILYSALTRPDDDGEDGAPHA